LRVDVEDALPLARCAPDALREIIEVLVENAERHGRGAVKIRARRLDPGVIVDVEDEGPGITGDPEAIFERRGPRASGTGIGLALARAVAEAHGARLRLTRAAPHPVFSIMLTRATIEGARTNEVLTDI
jgi:signal transduction histidine kinase